MEPKEKAERRSTPELGGRGVMSSAVAVGLGLAVVIGGALAYRHFSTPVGATPSASASGPVLDRAPRCVDVAPGKLATVGEPSHRADQPSDPADEAPDRDDLLSPFAVVLGRAVAYEGGFAMGVQGEGEGGTLSTLVLVTADGSSAKPIRLSRSRGDLDPPVVAVDGKGFLVALIEPNAGGRAVRVARVENETVSWGAELRESNDDSLALDLAVSKDHALVAWDAIEDDKSYIAVSAFPTNAIGQASPPRRLSPDGADADAPRLVPRPGGFYAVYQVRGLEKDRHAARPAPPAGPEPSSEPAPKKKPKTKRDPGDVDETMGGEAVAFTWLEVLILDETGGPAGDAVRLTPADGHVISYDVAPAADGGLVVAYRDEDSPTGAGGGLVKAVRIAPGGGEAERYQSPEEAPSDGAPTLLPGWMAIPTLRGPDLLGRLGQAGMPSEAVDIEPSLGRGEPIAARGDELLLAEPEGKAMRLRVVKCGDRPAPPPPAPDADTE
ncbi:MAG: hypothetical protein JNL21_09000 [Myxococcales bacterium]|nr:hypothetical protein [Myxococcales bacterium]